MTHFSLESWEENYEAILFLQNGLFSFLKLSHDTN